MNHNQNVRIRDLTDDEYFLGHKACGGCGGSLAIRLALKVLGPRVFTILPAGCMSAVGFIYPQLAFAVNAMISTFPGTASMLSGVAAGAKALGLKDYSIVGFAGDGGTADIGLQALSGAIDRNDRIIYICYDNEAYMNTGIQKSGLTPFGAQTTTTPAASASVGSITAKKNMFEIVAAHGIAYAATASIANSADLLGKINKAKSIDGTSYIHIFAPCPTGWGYDPSLTLDICRKAVNSGLWYLAEFENGTFSLNYDPGEFIPLSDYLSMQKRFSHFTEEMILSLQTHRDAKWREIRHVWKKMHA
ncbi:MAG: pyruvate synthase subunit beta [Fibrobacter sp.]|nr:pyruvate synthase subunit beta [Fibrobacter sp.]